jgi:hypothetical protein
MVVEMAKPLCTDRCFEFRQLPGEGVTLCF